MDGSTSDKATGLTPQPRNGVLRINPYKGGKGGAESARRVIKLSSNENPTGPSLRAIEAYRRAADKLGVYPDGDALVLKEAIAGAHNLDPARIICGAGSDELIGLLCTAYAGPGAEVIHTEYAFAMYRIYALASGAEPISAPEHGITASVDAILEKVTNRTRIVFLANPNNPTGTYLPQAEIERLANALPDNVILALDAAYAEYLEESDYDSGVALASARPNVVTTRTFSKVFGLSALRIGWLYGPAPIVDALNRIRSPFNVNAPAIAAGAAAVEDFDFIKDALLQNEVWRDWLTKKLLELGVDTPPSFANFVLPRFNAEGPHSAAAVDAFLRSKDIYVRRMESYGMPDRLRITVGAPTQNTLVVDALTEFLQATA